MKKHLLILLSLFAAAISPALSQSPEPRKFCGTTELYNDLIKSHPEVIEYEKAQNMYSKKYAESVSGQKMLPVYIIPVVFHILHEYGVENISDAQVQNEIDILNTDYRRLNADTTAAVPAFQGLIADCEIEFRLATIDPNGNCTNGIEHVYSSETNIGDNGSKINQWPREKYLNVWVVKNISSGAAGYSQYPSAVLNQFSVNDGVMILSSYIGAINTGSIGTSRALTHEIGHYLNLAHTWGSTNSPGVSCGGDDYCADTPETKGWTVCNLNGSICNPPIIENVQNYMEYSYCSMMFTPDQKIRMRAALTNINPPYGFRANLWSSTNLAATGALANPAPVCVPVADFNAHTVYICAGNSATFTDASWKGAASSWSWSFPGGTPSTSTSQNPVIQYLTAGTYDVTLTVTNSAGSNTMVRQNNVVVHDPNANLPVPYTESFENITVPGNDWYVNDLNGGNTWTQSTSVGKTGTSSMMKNNFSGVPSGIDELVSAAVNLAYVQSASCTFQLAFAVKSNPTAGVNDQLRVLSSNDCGHLWSQRYIKKGLTLSTAGIIGSSSFTPNSSQWATQSFSLASSQASGRQNVRLKFEYTYDVGNNIYLDDININGIVGVEETSADELNLSVSPNPSSYAPMVSFTLAKSEMIKVNVTDMLGRIVESVENTRLDAGDHEYQLSPGMKGGVYFVQLFLGDQLITKKVVID